MKKISICQDNVDALQAMLDRYQTNARARVITPAILLDIVTKAEADLANLNLPKSQRRGARYEFTEGSIKAPSSYGSRPRMSNRVEIERGAKYWFVRYIVRDTFFPNQSYRCGLVLSTSLKHEAVRRFADTLRCYRELGQEGVAA